MYGLVSPMTHYTWKRMKLIKSKVYAKIVAGMELTI